MTQFLALGLRGVILDMDGLIFDTEALYLRGWSVVGEALGIPLTAEDAKDAIALSDRCADALFRERYGDAFSIEKAIPIMSEWIKAELTASGMPIKPGAREFIEYLHEQKIPFALGTSNHLHVAEAYLANADLLHYFDIMVTSDIVGAVKPAPDIFLKAAELLGLPPAQCLVLEDSRVGVTAGHAAGCPTIMVPDLLEPDAETRAKAWKVFDSLAEVQEALFS